MLAPDGRLTAGTGLPGSESPASAAQLAQLRSRGRLRGGAALLGPAFVAAVAYVDPGNFATNFSAGAVSGYSLAWVIVAANLMAMLVQYLSAKAGVATGRDLPELCREHLPRSAARGLWLQAELIAMATDVAEFVGAAIGLNLLFHVALLASGLITAVVAFGILGLQQRGYRRFELAVAGLLGLVLLGFAYDLVAVHPSGAAMAAGLVPRFGGPDGLLLAVGIIGATVMPHVVYLHSALTKGRVSCRDDAERAGAGAVPATGRRRRARCGGAGQSRDAVHGGGAVPARRVGRAAGRRVTGRGARRPRPDGRRRRGPRVRGRVAGLRAVVLQRGHVRRPGRDAGLHRPQRAAVPAAGTHHAAGPDRARAGLLATTSLVISQVVLSFGIPFALVPLVALTRRGDIMGALVNRRPTTWAATAALVIGLNVYLLASAL